MKQLFYNGKIHPMTMPEAYYDYMIVDGPYIAELGHGMPKLKMPSFDLKGRFVCPGFIDTHMHLLSYGASLTQCQLDDCTSIESLQNKLKQFTDTHAEKWIIGRGWNHDFFKEQRLPTKQDLDSICPDRPVLLRRACEHIAVANSKALEICNIDCNSFVEGGAIDIQNSSPTGILRENALSLITDHMPTPDQDTLVQYLKEAQSKLLSMGITTVHTDDLLFVSISEHLKLIDLMKSISDYPLRIYEQVQLLTPENINLFSNLGLCTGTGNSHFKIGPLKILADGSLGSRTARLSVPYQDDPKTQGISTYTKSELDTLIKSGLDHGFDLAIHAIGDYTNAIALETIEKYSEPNRHRHSIIHSQIMTLPLIQKMASLCVNALVQPVFLEYDMLIVKNRVGESLSQYSYAYKSMKDAGIKLGFGSDCPVESPNPLRSLHYAVTRTRPDGISFNTSEALTLYDALSAFTRDAAYFSHEEHLKGQLKKGYLADFVILSEDPYKTQLRDIKVDQTYIDGTCVYSRF
ncbi:amidohydrolase [Fusibacter ferrireducens]|uniref:Amidohydrolase family protein n=1 Tax=Fusibacter ferrireducens TaxID=2785058 RepID=A0ABR9ZRX1_9FIRM|nr:amidohydrolase [Fusibacter ferrireducens]MBF4693204.1 amidohydrolase family protein [Fusibacter ferrireducens]